MFIDVVFEKEIKNDIFHTECTLVYVVPNSEESLSWNAVIFSDSGSSLFRLIVAHQW